MGEFETTVRGLLNAKEMDANGEVVSFPVFKHEKGVGYCEVMKAQILGGTMAERGPLRDLRVHQQQIFM